MEEEWIDVRNFPDYMVSNFGAVYSWITNDLLTHDVMKKGYHRVYLYRNRTRYGKMVHQLVADGFVPGWDYGLEVNHIDGHKWNNIETNLEWVTSKYNTEHAMRIGLHKVGRSVEVLETGEIFPTILNCAQTLGIHGQRINEVLSGKRENYHGLRFRYAS